MPLKKDYFNALIAFLLGLTVCGGPIKDPDLGWHLFGGAFLWGHRELPSFDPINLFGSNWHDYHWLGQLLLFMIYRSGGFALLKLILGLTLGLYYLVIFDCCRIISGQKYSSLLVSLFVVVTALAASPIVSVRPQIFALLMVALGFRRLLLPSSKWELLQLSLLTIVLSNFHVYWVLIPSLWCVMRGVPSLRGEGCRTRAMMGALVLIACGAVSPYGGKNFVLVWDYLMMPTFLQGAIQELLSVFNVDKFSIGIFLTYLVLFVRTISIERLRRSPEYVLLLILGLLLAARNVKFLPFLGFFALPYLIPAAGTILEKVAPHIFERELSITRAAQGVLILLCTFITVRDFPSNTYPEVALNQRYPIEACERAADLAARMHTARPVRVVTHFNYGGWCRFAAFEREPALDLRVTTDGRTQNFPVDLYQKSFDLFNLRPGWRDTLKVWAPDFAVVYASSALTQGLAFLPGWKLEYQDDNFKLFSFVGS